MNKILVAICLIGVPITSASAQIPTTTSDPVAAYNADRAYIQSLKEYDLLQRVYAEQLRANQQLKEFMVGPGIAQAKP